MFNSTPPSDRQRPVSNPSPYQGTGRNLSVDAAGRRRESAPSTLMTHDSDTACTDVGQSQQRPISYYLPTALDTIHEIPPRKRDSDATLLDNGARPELDGKIGDFPSSPAVPPRMYRGGGRPEYDFETSQKLRSSQIPPNAYQYYLPYYNNTGKRPKKSLVQRVSDFFRGITEDQDIPSLPPSRTTSEWKEPIAADSSHHGAPAFGHGVLGKPQSHTKDDMFLRAMEINGDIEVRGALAVDADVQLYPQPLPNKLSETPHFLQKEKGDHNGDRVNSYKQRRRKPKHSIIYNRDSVINQQLFVLVLAKALLIFGAPSHRIEPQLASVAAIFELPAQFAHTPGCIQVSFGLPEQHASEVLLIKASVGLDLGRIHETHAVYRAVVRDEISASEGRAKLKGIIDRPPLYSLKLITILTFFQGFILCGSSFGGSLNDMWVSGILSVLVSIAQQRAARSELSASGADIFISAIVSLVARALSLKVPNRIFCYQAISSTSVAGLLPGSVMLQGVLDIASKNMYLGSSKVVAGLMTSLYLGFGLTLGSDVWLHFDKAGRNLISSTADKFEAFNGTFFSTNSTTPAWLSPTNLTGIWSFEEELSTNNDNVISGCYRDPSWPWPLRRLPFWSLFITLPILNLILSIKRNQPVKSIQMPVMILISCCSYAVTQVANSKLGFAGHPDYTALLGSFIVSLLGNLYSRRFGGTAFTVMLTGIWLLIPTGLAEAGGLSSSYIAPGEDEYTESLELARKMISVTIGVMSGVYLSARFIYTFGKKKNSAFFTL